jgi:hypothetical protein
MIPPACSNRWVKSSTMPPQPAPVVAVCSTQAAAAPLEL